MWKVVKKYTKQEIEWIPCESQDKPEKKEIKYFLPGKKKGRKEWSESIKTTSLYLSQFLQSDEEQFQTRAIELVIIWKQKLPSF